jgi:hypothetical protein
MVLTVDQRVRGSRDRCRRSAQRLKISHLSMPVLNPPQDERCYSTALNMLI